MWTMFAVAENSNPNFPVWGSDAWRTMLPGSYSFWYPTNPYTYRHGREGSGGITLMTGSNHWGEAQ